MVFVPWFLVASGWFELTFGWLIDRLGLILLHRRQKPLKTTI